MPTTARGIWSPSDTDNVDFTTHLATMAATIDLAIGEVANAQRGTASQRNSQSASMATGVLWQDTDGIRMIWRKDGAVWLPATWAWAGSVAQMNAFGQAPNGFSWTDTATGKNYIKLSGAWVERKSQVLAWGLVTMSTGTLPAVPSSSGNYGATVNFTVPTTFGAGEGILVRAVAVGTGFGTLSQVGLGTVSGPNTIVPCRFTQFGSNAPQNVTVLWEKIVTQS